MEYEIKTDNLICYAEQIQRLADRNCATLGFIPGKAYLQFAQEKRIYCAIENETVIAYILFRYNKKSNKVVLVHVCVDTNFRSTGIAKALIDTVVKQYSFAYLIEARCRRDYDLDLFWKQNGFHVISEKPGRSQFGSELKIWQRKIQTIDLIYLAQQAEADRKIVAVLDTNIIIELCDNPNGDARCLNDVSISDYVAYRITPECVDEISLKTDKSKRKKQLEFANRYAQTPESKGISATFQEISKRFDPTGKHEADVRHLGHCVDSAVDVFITNDTWLCKQRDAFREEYGIEILHPEEFYATIEERFDANAYIAETVVGSQYSEVMLNLEDLNEAAELAIEVNQKKKQFATWLRRSLTQANEELYLIKQKQDVVGLYALKQFEKHYELTQFIISKTKVNASIQDALMNAVCARITNRIAKTASPCTALVMTAEVLRRNTCVASEYVVMQTANGGLKLIVNEALTMKDALDCISDYIGSLIDIVITNDEAIAFKKVCHAIAQQQPLMLEKLLSPLILLDVNIPVWIVPIRAKYAVRLFDGELANMNQSFLHNEHEFAALSEIKSYYTKARRSFAAPCRVLWYVSYDAKYTGSRAIRACSVMRSFEIATKKALFARHKKYGVLSWREIDTIDENATLRVFTFDSTHSLPTPIAYDTLKQIVSAEEKKSVQLTSPNLVSNTVFKKLIQKGMEKPECTS